MRYWRSIVYYDHEPSTCEIIVAVDEAEALRLLAEHVRKLEDPGAHSYETPIEIEGPVISAWPDDPFEIGTPVRSPVQGEGA